MSDLAHVCLGSLLTPDFTEAFHRPHAGHAVQESTCLGRVAVGGDSRSRAILSRKCGFSGSGHQGSCRRLSADGSKIGARVPVCERCKTWQVHILCERQSSCMQPQYIFAVLQQADIHSVMTSCPSLCISVTWCRSVSQNMPEHLAPRSPADGLTAVMRLTHVVQGIPAQYQG